MTEPSSEPSASPSVDFTAGTDPLLRDVPLDLVLTLPVLGVPVRFETNSRWVLAIMEEAFGSWRAIGESLEPTDEPPLSVRVVVGEGSERSTGHAPVRHVCPDRTRVLIHSPGSFASVDPERGVGVAYVTTELVGDRAHFRETFLEAITLALITHVDRHPIHAAAVARDDAALLLAGPSGSGKSTLAYMAHAAGLAVLSDDKVWVQREPAFRLWGWPRRVNLLPDAPRFFPELNGVGDSLETNRKRKVAVDLHTDHGADGFSARRAVVCLLRRGAATSLERVAPDSLRAALTQELTSGFDRYRERLDGAVRELVGGGGWRLTLSSDPREALPHLERMLEAMDGQV